MAKQDKDKTENEFVDVSNIEEMQKEFMSTQEVKPKQKRVKKTQPKEKEVKREDIIQTNKIHSQEEKESIINDILLQVRLYGYSIRKIFRVDNPNKPSINRDTFYEWLKENKEFSDQYARACEERSEVMFEEILDIVDCEDNDVTEIDMDGITISRVNHDVIQRDRLRFDARKWILSKMNPKKYGDKIEVDSTIKGEITNNVIDYSKLSTDTLNDLLNNSQKND